jgi:hypothetical protein
MMLAFMPVFSLYCQNSDINKSKYWEYRHKLRTNFLKVGKLDGESIPMSTRSIGFAYNNVPPGPDSLRPSRIFFQDATIYLGHYLGVLALEISRINQILNSNSISYLDQSEYQILKRSTTNELYYAISAVNRLDAKAEFYLSGNNPIFEPDQINGLLLRDDVRTDFNDNFASDYSIPFQRPAHLNFTDGDYQPLDEWNAGIISNYNDGNVMSLDQLTSLLTGLRLVYEFADDIPVQPTVEDASINLKVEAKAIIFRILDYCINPTPLCGDCLAFNIKNQDGELVKMGADLTFVAPFLVKIGLELGHPMLTSMQNNGDFADLKLAIQVPTDFLRPIIMDMLSSESIQLDSLGGISFGGYNFTETLFADMVNNALDALVNITDPTMTLATIEYDKYVELLEEIENQNVDFSVGSHGCFETTPPFYAFANSLRITGLDILDLPFLDDSFLGDFIDDIQNLVPNFNGLGLLGAVYVDAIQSITSMECFESFTPIEDTILNDINVHLILELAALSNSFSPEYLHYVSHHSDMEWYSLLQAVLHNQGTPTSPLLSEHVIGHYYNKYINSAPCVGPWSDPLDASNPNATPGWKGANRLFHPNDSEGISDPGFRGEFSGLDYMMYYNLFQTLWPDAIYERELSCSCAEEVTEATSIVDPLFVVRKFPDYHEKRIPIESFLAHSVEVHDAIDVENDFIICRKDSDIPTEVHLNSYGSLVVHEGNRMTVQPGNSLVLEAISFIQVGTSGSYQGTTELILEEGAVLHLKASSGLDIIRGARVVAKVGARIILEDGARISVDHTSSLHLQNGAQLIYKGGILELNDWNACLVLNRGQVVCMPQTEFTIQSSAYLSKGYILVENAGASFPTFYLHENASVRLQGENENDLLLRSLNEAPIVFQTAIPSSEVNIQFLHGELDLGNNSYIKVNSGMRINDCNVHSSLDDATANATIWSDGGKMFIGSSHFYNSGISGVGSSIIVSNSQFEHTNERTSIYSTGGNYRVQDSHFEYGRVASDGLENASSIVACTFRNDDLIGQPINGHVSIEDESIVEIKVRSVEIWGGNIGIKKTGGKLTLACSEIHRCNTGILARQGCVLNMARKFFGGFNYFANNSTTIELEDAEDIWLMEGHNSFASYTHYNIAGTIRYNCDATSCEGPAIYASENQWPGGVYFSGLPGSSPILPIGSNPVISGPNPDHHLIFSSFDVPIDCNQLDGNQQPCRVEVVATLNLLERAECEVRLPHDFEPHGLSLSTEPERAATLSHWKNLDSLEAFELPVLNSPHFAGFTLDSALDAAASYMELYQDSLGNDLFALDLFHEILIQPLNLTGSKAKEVWSDGLGQMKSCFENIIGYQQETSAEVLFSLPATSKYVEVLNLSTDSVISAETYHRQFLIETYKGQFFWTLGLAEEAQAVFTHLSDCSLDSTEQAMLNQWRAVLLISDTLDIQIATTIPIDSFSTAIDTSDFIAPSSNILDFYMFGAYIQGPHAIDFVPCQGFGTLRRLTDENNSVVVFPNPSNGQFNVQLTTGKINYIEVFDMNGRKIHLQRQTDSEGTTMIWNASETVSPGMYFLRIYSEDGISVVKVSYLE